MIERQLVAEEEGFVGGHRLDHLDGERGGAGALELADQFAQAVEPMPARDRQQAAFGEVLLFRRCDSLIFLNEPLRFFS